MRSRTTVAASRRTYLDPAKWLHEGPAHAALQHARPRLKIVPRPAVDQLTADQGLTIECLDWEQASLRLDDWLALARECHENNVFLEPGFALSAAQHYPPAHRPLFLFVSEAGAPQQTGRLVAIFAITRPTGLAAATVKLWRPPEMPQPNPLVHRDHGVDILAAVLNWLGNEFPATRSMLWPAIRTGGPISTLLRECAHSRNLDLCQFDLRGRAILVKDKTVRQRLAESVSSKRAKELRRLQRRLGEMGTLSYRSAVNGADIRNATEEFLALEAKGWKGRHGAAMLADPSLATFARTMARRFAAHEQCEIDGLYLDGRPIAMGVVLRSGSQAFFWKTAYDEDFASFSPGVQLTLALTERLLDDPAIERIDSCAMPNHPMIDRIWPDRSEMVDVMIALDENSANSLVTAASVEGAKRKLRGMAKKTYYRLRRRQPS